MRRCLVALSVSLILFTGTLCFAKELKIESPASDMIQGVWEGSWSFRNNSGTSKVTIFGNEALFLNSDRRGVYRYESEVTLKKDEITIRRKSGTRTDYYELFKDEKGDLLLKGQYITSSGSVTASAQRGSIELKRVGDVPEEIKSQGYLIKHEGTTPDPEK